MSKRGKMTNMGPNLDIEETDDAIIYHTGDARFTFRKNDESFKARLKEAFEAGEAFSNECHCGECDYCVELNKGMRSPDFETWYKILINKLL